MSKMQATGLGFLFFWLVSGVFAQTSLTSEPALPVPASVGPAKELSLQRKGSTTIDLSTLPRTAPRRRERPEHEAPKIEPIVLPGSDQIPPVPVVEPITAAAPAPIANFLGLDFLNWGGGYPPDTVGDVGPTHYIQAVNTSIGIYLKATGAQVAAFSFDTFMSLGNFGNLCDTDNFGDPVVLYDSFEDRWVITDFAFQIDGSNNVVSPPGAFQCFAVSQTGDPVSGGWYYYSIQVADALHDYPKFGIWPDGIYMSANMFPFPANSSYIGPRVWALNKAQMYAGSPTVQVVEFNPPANEFTLLPANARLQTGTPPVGAPNYFSVVWRFANAISVYKFDVDWNSISLSTFTGPTTVIAPASWSVPPATVPAQGGANNETLQVRLMMQNQYTRIGGVESLWNSHTVLGAAAGTAAPRWYQVTVTGGVVAATTTQAATHTPDSTVNRYISSLAVDRAGDMAIGYSASSSSLMPAIRYAGRLATDPVNTLPQTETTLVAGTGSQTGTNRWGDYSAMTLDPNGCTFWYTNEYYITTGTNWQTRIGSFQFPSCTPVGTGTLQGTVTATTGGAPISGATLTLGSRTTTTNGSGFYQFSALPAGVYPSLVASAPGFLASTVTNLTVNDGSTTVQNFSLATAASSGCLVDTSQADFQTGIPANVDLTTSAGNVVLFSGANLDQQNLAVGNNGYAATTTTWSGQTFTPSVTGQLTRADLTLFCSGCTGTTPNLTLSVRATSGGLPTGADLATATITGFGIGPAVSYTANFGSPPTLTAGTVYALVIRPTANPSPGTYALSRSGTSSTGANVYSGGAQVISTTSGASWSIPLAGGVASDAGFKVFIKPTATSGNFVSSLKDSNPAAGMVPTWTTLSWTATVPAGTTLRFQVAASNSAAGPFNFVGPDGTAATFFTTSGASLSQFNQLRYLKYKAYLTTSSAATPTLNDVTVCFAVVPRPDLSISKTDGVTTAVPGSGVVYTITATNPSTVLSATGATVTDTFPASLTCSWTCAGSGGGSCPASGAGNINTAVTLPPSSSITFTATCAIQAAATGSLVNTANITSTGDPVAGNNSATDTDTLTPSADVSITKTDGVATEVPGTAVTYSIVVSNSGPSVATGVTVTDTFPGILSGCSTTSVAAGGATGNDAGPVAGNLNDSGITLPVGASVTYTATCNISAGATGSLVNTASVTSATSDPASGNNSATDTDTLVPSADVAITKTDGVTSVSPGSSVVYTIVASNNGPSSATGVTVADTFPAVLTGCSTTSVASAGTTGNDPGPTAGNINDSGISLPSLGSVIYTSTCTLDVGATGTLVNTATITSSTTDPSSGNNSSTDTDTVSPLDFGDAPSAAQSGFASSYPTLLANDGARHIASGLLLGANRDSESNGAPTAAADGDDTTGTPDDEDGVSFATLVACQSTTATATVTAAGRLNAWLDWNRDGDWADAGEQIATDLVVAAGSNAVNFTVPCNASIGVTYARFRLSSATGLSFTGLAADGEVEDHPVTITTSGDLSVSKTDGVTSAVPGQTVVYTIVVSNAGPSPMAGVSLTDTFPVVLSCGWTSVASGGATGNTNNSGPANLAQTLSLPVGSSVTYTVTCSINASATGTLTNTATVATTLPNTSDPNSANNSATDNNTVLTPIADVAITKTDGAATEVPGTPVTYTIVVSNSGASVATGVTVTDTFPGILSGCSTTSVAAGGASGNDAGPTSGNISDGGITLPVGATVTYTATCNISAGATGSLVNTASVTSATSDPVSGNNSATDTDTLAPSADVAITKTDGATTEVPGTAVTYTIAVSNSGPGTATGVTVTDTFPAVLSGCSTTSIAAGGATGNDAGPTAGNISDGGITLPVGATVTYTATCNISATATGSLANTASVTSATSDPASGNNSATDTDTLVPSADVAITKTDGVTTEVPGTAVIYTIVVTNSSGPSVATGVTVTDTFPGILSGCSTTSVASGGAAGNDAGPTAGNISDGGITLPAGATVTYTATCNISAGATGSLVNTASVTSATSDPASGNNSATDTDTLVPSADVAITKTDGATTEVPGAAVTYTIVVSNSGPGTATGVTVTDTFPAVLSGCSTTSIAAGGATGNDAGPTAGNISDGGITLPVGATVTYTATCNIDPAATGSLANTASVTSSTSDPASGNNSATDTDALGPSAEVAITKTDGVTSVSPGSSVVYTIVASNNGPSSATGVTVADTFPAVLTGCSTTSVASGGATGNDPGPTAGNINDSGISLPPSSSVTYTSTCTLDVAATGTLANTATITSSTTDPSSGNNSSTDTDTVSPLDFGDAPSAAQSGFASSYPTLLANDGARHGASGLLLGANRDSESNGAPTAAADGDDTTGTPDDEDGVSFATLVACQSTTATATVTAAGRLNAWLDWNRDGDWADAGEQIATDLVVAAGSNAVNFTVPCSASIGATYARFRLSSATGLSFTGLAANGEVEDHPVTITTSGDLSVSKTDGVTSAVPGQTVVVYTIVVSNAGPSPMAGVSLTDTFPVVLSCGWTSVASGGATGNTNNSGPANLAQTLSLPVGSSVTYTVTCSINASATGTLTNTATVATTLPNTSDPNSANNSATDNNTVLTPIADVSISKTDGAATEVPGTPVTYTIVVSNSGASVATGVTVTDTFPGILSGCSTTSIAAGGAAGNDAGPVAGNLNDSGITLPAGATVTYTATCNISAGATGSLVNTASVTSATSDPVPGNNSATDTDTLAPSADVAITKTDGVTTEVPGTAVTYTIVVTNSGPGTATGVTVTDTFPAVLSGCSTTSIAAGGASGNDAGPVAGNLNDSGISLPVGSSVTYTATCNINPAATGSLVNTASVTSATSDPVSGNNSATDTDVLGKITDLAVSKTSDTNPASPGQIFNYLIAVTNLGPSNSSGFTITDTLPAATAVSFQSASGSGWSCGAPVGLVLTCTHGALAAGATSANLSVQMQVAAVPAPPTFTNSVSVSTSENDPVPANNTANVQVSTDLTPPVTTNVNTVEDTGDGVLANCETVRVRVGQILVRFSEAMLVGTGGADDPTSYLLVQPGPNATFDTTSCAGGISGDDFSIVVNTATYQANTPSAPSSTVTLALNDQNRLHFGLFRLLACDQLQDLAGNQLDGDGTGGAGGDFVLDFRIDAFDLFANAHFDCGPGLWSSFGASWTAASDYQASPHSGAIQATQNNAFVDQCVTLGALSSARETAPYDLAGRLRLDPLSNAVVGWSLSCVFFSGPACTGSPTAAVGTMGNVTAPTVIWLAPKHRYVTLPVGAVSARCGFDFDSLAPFVAEMDGLIFRGNGVLFEDGFESGTTAAWN